MESLSSSRVDETELGDAGSGPASGSAFEGKTSAPRSPRRSAVRVRLPESRDWPSIKALVRAHHARTIFSHIPFSDAKYEALEREAREPALHQCLIVAERRGEIVGMAWFSAGDYVLGDGLAITTTHLLAVDADRVGRYLSARIFLRLLKAITLWSQTRKVASILVHVSTGRSVHLAHKLLTAAGAQCIGGSYQLTVPNQD